MDPRIQYAQTKDGLSIAFWALGEGTPLIYVQAPQFSHAQMEWQMPEFRVWYERLTRMAQLIRYDPRGTGLSEREVSSLSLEEYVLDLEAVVDHLGLEQIAIVASLHAGPVGITYAARHPERLSHLLLWCAFARHSDLLRLPAYQALLALRNQDWTTFTETVAHSILGWSHGEEAGHLAAYLRECTTPETAFRALDAAEEFDVWDLLPKVKAPTLVIQRRQVPFPDVNTARGLASRIPDARLAIIEGDAMLPLGAEGADLVGDLFEEFIGDVGRATTDQLAKAAVHTILFTDIESSTSLRQGLGDERAQELVRVHNTIVRDALKAQGGIEIKHTGDGIMASFPVASAALHAAIAMQRALAAYVLEHDAPLRVYIGLNAGEPIAEEQDLFGTSVDLAARICARAEPGQILASDVVRQLAAGKGLLFADIGQVALRGFEDPVRLYDVLWRE
ncbi:MAG: alpha/beta fold hydrolase [Chloroflexi bacterium]|nr:alpha/beta fold hydrolase [Chloroflexota bacterium]